MHRQRHESMRQARPMLWRRRPNLVRTALPAPNNPAAGLSQSREPALLPGVLSLASSSLSDWVCGARRDSGAATSGQAQADEPPPQAAFKANIRFTFQAMVTRLHWPCTFSSPRKRNWRNPSADLIMPKTGSGMHLSWRQALAFGRLQAAAMASTGVGFCGAGGAPANRSLKEG